MERASGAHAKPYRCDLSTSHVHPRCALASDCRNSDATEHFDNRLFERFDNPAYPDLRSAQVEKQICNQLARPVVGDLPSPIGTNDGNRSSLSHMAASSGLPQREDPGMLEQPEFVG